MSSLENTLLHRGGKQTGNEISFRCPFPDRHEHGDAHPSASYNLEKEVWYCHVCKDGGVKNELCRLLGVSIPKAAGPEVVATYLYSDEGGNALRRKRRWEPGFRNSKKSFSWEKPDSHGGWIKCQGDGNPKKLYGSEKLPLARENGELVLVVEGEKDVDTGTRLGICAVCNPEGAAGKGQRSKWRKSYSRQLEHLAVKVIADKDEPGRTHAEAVAASLQGTASSVAVLEMPGERVKDLSDWTGEKRRAGWDLAKIRNGLEELCLAAPPWSPAQDSEVSAEKGKKERGPTQAQQLIELASGASLFHSPDETALATVIVRNHEEVWPIGSRSFRRWLLRKYFEANGKPPNSQALKDTCDLLAARAQFDGEEHPIFKRLASLGGRIYLDLGNQEWSCVEVTTEGWRVLLKGPVKFIRTKGMQELPQPTAGGSVLALKKYINVPGESSFLLVVAWLLAALRPQGPFPILVLQGEQGSAKSTAARMLRSLVDPATSPIRAVPRDEHDLMIAAQNAWLLAFDNLSGIPSWLSDALCRLATGGGFSTRQLYTDAEETIFDAQRPVILNGIEELTSRQDLLDRAVIVELPPIPSDARRPESEIWAEFEAERPKILGALLTAVSAGLRELPNVELPSLPRMADFAKWTVATESALPWPKGSLLRAYSSNREESVDLALESDLVASALLALLETHQAWQGTATELLAELGNHVPERTQRSRAWPKTARALSGRLRRAATFLRTAGVEMDFLRESGSRSRRLVQIRKLLNSSVATVATVASSPGNPREPGENGATQEQAATQSATQNELHNPPRNGTCDGSDGSDARLQTSSAMPYRETPRDHSRAQTKPMAALAGSNRPARQHTHRKDDSREVWEL